MGWELEGGLTREGYRATIAVKSNQASGIASTVQLWASMVNLSYSPENALIFRITHIKNVPWILANGLHCCNSACRDPNFCEIGNTDLIDKRSRHRVPTPPGGTLGDYIPFYFTPHSPMLLNIKTGRNVKMTPMPDIAILVTSLHKVREDGMDFVFTDRHAYVAEANFSSDLSDLNLVDWELLRKRDFATNPDDPGKRGRYMAEALIYQHLSLSSLLGIACYGQSQEAEIREEVARLGLEIDISAQPGWYF